MEDPDKYIMDMKLGRSPGDDGIALYNRIIEAEFELESKRISLEKEMAMNGFHLIPETEINPPKYQKIYFDPITKELEFEWGGQWYRSTWLLIDGKQMYCIIKDDCDIFVIKDEKTLKLFLDLILV